MSLTSMIDHDAPAFQARLAPWLAADPARYALTVGIARMSDAWRAVVLRDGVPEVALVQTRPRLVVLDSPHPPRADAVAAVAELLRAHALLSGVRGTADWVAALTTALERRPRASEHDRLHRLIGPPRLPRPAAGAMRPPDGAQVDLLCAWQDAFRREALPRETMAPTKPEAMQGQLADLRLWIVDGAPVAVAARARPLLGGWTISMVYTPPAQRRQGYAGALVHALSAELVASGATYVALYTDLANPTSNALYARIGFVAQLDQARQFWEMP